MMSEGRRRGPEAFRQDTRSEQRIETTREQREQHEGVMDKRHRMATAAFAVEQYIWEGGDYHPDELRTYIEKLNAPEALKEQLRLVAEAFLQREVELDDLQAELEQILEIEDLDAHAEHAASVIFVSMVDDEPRGRVAIRREPGFFVMEYDEGRDFANVTVDRHSKREKGAIAQTWGTFHGRSPICIRLNESVSHVELPEYDEEGDIRLDDYAPIVHVNREGVASDAVEGKSIEEAVQAIARHERSHAIFDYFKNEYDPFDDIKDELLARIREGATPNESTEFLEDPDDYAYLKKGRGGHFLKQASSTLDGVYESLNDLEDLFPEASHRGVLTYHLMDIDFEEVPDHLVRLTRYYTELLEPLIEAGPPDEYHPHTKAIETIRKQEQPTLLAKQALVSYDTWTEAYDAYYDRAILTADMDMDVLVEQLGVLEYHAQEDYVAYMASAS